jgi:hypothetical protein
MDCPGGGCVLSCEGTGACETKNCSDCVTTCGEGVGKCTNGATEGVRIEEDGVKSGNVKVKKGSVESGNVKIKKDSIDVGGVKIDGTGVKF